MFCSFSVEPKNKQISYDVTQISPVVISSSTQNFWNANTINNFERIDNFVTNSNINNAIRTDPGIIVPQSISSLSPPAHHVAGTKKRKWTADEDYLLMQAVNAYGVDNWNLVAQRIENRTGKQCRERWMSNMCPSLIKDTWSPQEDLILIQKQSEFGNKWTLIHNFLPGRSNTAIKNRWKCLCRRNMSKHCQDFRSIFNYPRISISKTHLRPVVNTMHSKTSSSDTIQPKKASDNIQDVIDSLFDGDCWNDLEATLSLKV